MPSLQNPAAKTKSPEDSIIYTGKFLEMETGIGSMTGQEMVETSLLMSNAENGREFRTQRQVMLPLLIIWKSHQKLTTSNDDSANASDVSVLSPQKVGAGGEDPETILRSSHKKRS